MGKVHYTEREGDYVAVCPSDTGGSQHYWGCQSAARLAGDVPWQTMAWPV